MKTQEILFRTTLEFTNELTFLDFTKIENQLIQEEEKRINRMISRYNDIAVLLDGYLPRNIKKMITIEFEKLDADIELFIANFNIDLEKITERVNEVA